MRVFKRRYVRDGQRRESKRWYVEVKDHRGIDRRIPGFTDRKLTEEFGRRLERLIGIRMLNQTPPPDLAVWIEQFPTETLNRLTKLGILDGQTVSGSKPLADHLADYRQSLLDKGGTLGHADLKSARVRRTIDGCGFLFFSDIVPGKVVRYLADCRTYRQADRKQKMSVQTSNHYLTAIKGFCRWMVSERRATESPVEHLSGLNVKIDRRRERRNLTGSELHRLIETTAAGPFRWKRTGIARAILYRLAAETGLRRKELASLTADSFDFDRLTVSASASETKNHQEAELPMRPETATMVQRFVQTTEIASESPLWPKLTRKDGPDAQGRPGAGIPYVDESGHVADFHSLRHSFISLLAAGGVHPKLAQTLARHSDINLTMTRYSHTVLTDEADALSALPSLPSPYDESEQDRQVMQPTGTEGGGNSVPLCVPESGAFEGVSVHFHAPNADDGSTGGHPLESVKQAMSSGEGGIL